ncbi:MAG: hypothetical protein ACTHMS_07100 [Jatrophihabitans sp.]|uniref:hypothetical protein n=1 Tax=Jatrophihabitans sp. TaxID=1932789 RepID=UPI003F7FC5D1
MLLVPRRDARRSLLAHAAVVGGVWVIGLPIALRVGSPMLWAALAAAGTGLGLLLHLGAFRHSADAPAHEQHRVPTRRRPARRRRGGEPGIVVHLDDWSSVRRGPDRVVGGQG